MIHHKLINDTIYEHTIPPTYQVYDQSTIRKIIAILAGAWFDKHKPWESPDWYELYKVSWRWEIPRYGYFTQRIAKFAKEYWNLNLSSNVITNIGNVAAINADPTGPIYFDITQDLTWKSGDFGDSGSCFWSNRKETRSAMMKEGNFYALRIFQREVKVKSKNTVGFSFSGFSEDPYKKKVFKEDKDYRYYGLGRSWLYETTIKIKVKEKKNQDIIIPILIIFNSYGLSIQEQSLILTSFLEKQRSPITLTNKGKNHGGLYFNGAGYVIGPAAFVQAIKHYDFSIDNEFDKASETPQPLDYHHRILLNKEQALSRKPSNREERIERKRQQAMARRDKIRSRDEEKGILHQRFALDLINAYNRDCFISFKPYGPKPKNKEEKKKLDSQRHLITKLDYDPIKIINHHIKNHVLQEV